jgi:hypothetical protein
MSSRPIPPRPSLEFDRQQAKALLDALHRGDADAAQRFRTHHPRFGPQGAPGGAALHEAQLVIAREYGFASWPGSKQFVEARQLDARERAAALSEAFRPLHGVRLRRGRSRRLRAGARSM